MKRQICKSAAMTAALILPLSCGSDDKGKDRESSGENGNPSVPGATATEGGDTASAGKPGEIVGKDPHFLETVSHLDVGGTVFHYMDMDGDLAAGATKVDELLSGVLEMMGDNLPPQLKGIKVRDILFETGLENVKAVGLSSYDTGGGVYHNKMYVHIPGGREGLLKALGGKPAPLISRTLAPADAVAVIEHDLNLKPILEVVQKIVERIGDEDIKSSFAGGLASNAAGLGITLGDLFGKLDTKLTVILSLYPDRQITIPGSPEIKVPEFDVLIAADNMGWLVDQLMGALPDDAKNGIERGDGFKRLTTPDPVGPGDLEIYKPVFHHDEKADRLFVASRVEYLDRCLSQAGPRLTAGAEYQSLTANLPAEGNGFYYFSRAFWPAYMEILESIEPGQTAQMEALFNSGIMQGITKSGGAQVDVNLDRGWKIVSNYPQSHKATLLGLALAPSVGLAVAGAVAFPMMAR